MQFSLQAVADSPSPDSTTQAPGSLSPLTLETDQRRFLSKSLLLIIGLFYYTILGIFSFHFLSLSGPRFPSTSGCQKISPKLDCIKSRSLYCSGEIIFCLQKPEREKLKSLQIEIHSYIFSVVLLNGSMDGNLLWGDF